ncbi:hypothetical protein HRJ45_15045 [Vibrio coralliilyticus]|uniref:gamma-mobile-trio protein GmtX n=1 Tax=Vibrio coralliilyticus TaxID=190893 RepID=UPI00155F9CD5|nr:gamma-mobile-trio protein GmtX [Vibrio coralliilyticus]NRF26353.1 hypothetical protein [Vibrio coralliilyticus]NRF80428.1 hypothetical protein [Vibrio coralliilyticus]
MHKRVEDKDSELINRLEAIYQALREQCKTARSKNSIDIVNKACEEIAKGSRDFSISIVGHLSSSNAGPGAQSISNKNGQRYRELINAYKSAYPQSTKLRTTTHKNWIDQIQQPGVKGNVLIMRSELRKLREENKTLRNLLANKDELVVTLNPSSQSQSPYPSLTETDYESLKSAIDAERLKKFDLRIGEGGSIENEAGSEVFEIGFSDAIKKIIAINSTKAE